MLTIRKAGGAELNLVGSGGKQGKIMMEIAVWLVRFVITTYLIIPYLLYFVVTMNSKIFISFRLPIIFIPNAKTTQIRATIP